MEADLQTLEDRIGSLAMLCRQLRRENIELRQEVLVLKNDNRRLTDKVEVAKVRVEALIARLPDEDEDEQEQAR
ncbi:hypothetical protein [Chitinimonas koreensis]|uniref:hypothetical protein n=1 Tax=Chitinimonas koreensis TaxID=356302 RepID=UPI00040D5864|nr:hypothetical protein [Chitinimonas koreensis]QNM96630.1 hypothetical protein H9L41_23230 [Chitinimonas koreensis]